MRYEISETLEISIYADGDLLPFWYQPDYPNGEKFDEKVFFQKHDHEFSNI